MPRLTDTVEIQGPPIDEIQKRSSCLKQGCISGLLFILGILVFFIVIMQIFIKPHSTQLTSLPYDFPESVDIYDKENVDHISYTPGDERAEAIEFLAFVPKAVLSPLIMAMETADSAAGVETENLWESFIRILGTPVADHRHVVSIEWSELQANEQFIHSFYKTTLEKEGFVETTTHNTTSSRFVHDDGITVVLSIEDDGNTTNGVDYAILHVYYPRQ